MTLKYIKPEHGSLEWLQLRHRDEAGRVRFGASEAPILMGVSKFKSIVDLALEKWVEPEVREQNDAMKRGHRLEPALINYASELLGEKVTTPEEMFVCGRFIATLDGVNESGDIIVECKTTTYYSSDDPLPEEYYWQVVAQMACYPVQKALVVVLDKRMRFGYWEVLRNQDDIDLLHERADEVGETLDDHRIPGDLPLREEHVKALYPSPEGSVELGSSGPAMIATYLAAKENRINAEREEQASRDILANELGNAEFGLIDGMKVVSFKAQKGRVRFDTKALERDHPEIAAKYKVEGDPIRVLRMMGEK